MDAVEQVESALWYTCHHLLMYHTNPWELDEALQAAGFIAGPCEMQDHAGLAQVLARGSAHCGPVLPRMVSEGRLGKISGVGFYRYPGGGGAVIDPLIEDLILEEAHFGKIHRTHLSDAEIVVVVSDSLTKAIAQWEPDKTALAERLRLNRTSRLGTVFNQ